MDSYPLSQIHVIQQLEPTCYEYGKLGHRRAQCNNEQGRSKLNIGRRQVLPLVPKGGYMVSFDFKSGYHHVKMHPNFTSFLGLSGGEKSYKFLDLPFDLSPAPFIFTKLFRPLLKKWREAGIEVALYLDDGLIWASSAQLCEESVRIVREDLKLAGVTMANAVGPGPKHFVVGTRLWGSRGPSLLDRLKRLGYIASLHLIIPPDLNKRWRHMMTEVAAKQSRSTALSFRWNLSVEEKSVFASRKKFDYSLSEISIQIPWIPLSPPRLGLRVRGDFVRGARFETTTAATLPLALQGESSTAREVFAILASAKAFGRLLGLQNCIWYSDSQCASLALRIWDFCNALHANIDFVWIPRALNGETDLAF
ncbi:hypothetical protein COOONC_24158 [Cooperia oncophora]